MDSWAATNRALLCTEDESEVHTEVECEVDTENESEDAGVLSLVELVLAASECTEDEFELSEMVREAVGGRVITL